MTPSQGPWPGRFVWHDLMTTDAKKSQAFYTALFDWQVREATVQGTTYRMIVAGPGPIGGIVEEKDIPASHWMPYACVTDVDAAAQQVTSLGGSVCVPPTDIPNVGRFAVVGDPTGACFTLYKGQDDAQGFDPDLPVAGRVCWNELLTKDPAKAQQFYTALFGWVPESKDVGPMGTYHVQKLNGKEACGLMKNPQNGAPDCWLAYFLTPSLKDSTKKAKQLGATILMDAAPIPDIGAFSLVADPVGAVICLFEPAMRK